MRQREGCLDGFSPLSDSRVSTGERQAVDDDEPGLRGWVVKKNLTTGINEGDN